MKIAVIQNEICERFEDNVEHMNELVLSLLEKEKVDFLMLPEYFNGPAWFHPGQEYLRGITDDEIPGKISDNYCAIAKKFGVYIIMGTIVERKGDKYRITSTFINNNGEIGGKSSKTHLFAGEIGTCEASTDVNVYDTKFGKAGIAVCSDFWIVEVTKILALKGAKLIFIPGVTLGQHIGSMKAALKSCAFLTSSIVVYAGPVRVVGKEGDNIMETNICGTSLIASPEKFLAVGSIDKEETLVVEIPDNYIDEYRANPGNEVWRKINNQDQSCFSELLTDYK